MTCTKTEPNNDLFLNCWRKTKELSKKELSNVVPASTHIGCHSLKGPNANEDSFHIYFPKGSLSEITSEDLHKSSNVFIIIVLEEENMLLSIEPAKVICICKERFAERNDVFDAFISLTLRYLVSYYDLMYVLEMYLI